MKKFFYKTSLTSATEKNIDADNAVTLDHGVSVASPDRVPRGIELEENRVYFYCIVDSHEALELNRILRRLDVEMQYLSSRLSCKEVPIYLHIHSPGGSIFAGLSIVDTIKSCKTPVYTHIDGSAASAATLISIAGAQRSMGKNSYMLIHQPQIEWSGKFDEFIDEIENQKSLYDKVVQLYLENTSMKEKELKDMLDHELWLDSEKCLELGLIDEVT